MAKNRDRIQIVGDILMAAKASGRKTHILHGANLSHGVLTKYLERCLGLDLLRFHGDSQTFAVTEKGSAFLAAYVELRKFSEAAESAKARLEGLLGGEAVGLERREAAENLRKP